MPAPKRVLLIGGSGFVSGAVARASVAAGHRTFAVTRGERSLPEGVAAVKADRHDQAAFAQAVAAAGEGWDLVVDCIGFDPADARQDVAVFSGLVRQFAFISTDFVYDPARRQFPQPLDGPFISDDSYGGKKRRCELEFINGEMGATAWTIIRPCHVFGPGSLLGCLPEHGRDRQLIERLRARQPLRLVGGGHFLQQPIFAADLAALVLSVLGNARCAGKAYPAAGGEIIESRRYYETVAEALGVALTIDEVSVQAYRREHPEATPFLCHRVYDLSPLKADGLTCPATPISDGLVQHVRSMS